MVDPEQSGATAKHLRLALEAQDIEARPTWKPLHLQPLLADIPAWSGRRRRGSSNRACASRAGRASLTADLARVVEVIRPPVALRVGSHA